MTGKKPIGLKELNFVKALNYDLEAKVEQIVKQSESLGNISKHRDSLAAENQKILHRQQLMNEELVKAEGQISLIEDLLLIEKAL